MKLDLVFKNYTSQKAPGREFFRKILETAVKEIKKLRNKEVEKLRNFSVSINLVGEKKIQELNKKYRGKNKPTDVLSFPIGEGLEIRNSKLEIEEDVGDIFLCLSIAKNDAKRENISIKKKLAQLTVHGFLHLQGYDHEKSHKDADKMLELENRILSKVEDF